VNPKGKNASVSQPRIVRHGPSGTLSFVVGGCAGPISTSRKIITSHQNIWK